MIEAVLRGSKKVQQQLKKEFQQSEKDLNVTLKVEGFSLMKEMRKEIRKSHAGGKRFVPLSHLARGTKAKKKPLRRLASAVRYAIRKKRQFEVVVGFPKESCQRAGSA